MATKKRRKLSEQVRAKTSKKPKAKKEYDGNFETVISTGSTLLDLAISGSQKKGGGLPGGILVEIFGESSTGKTVLLSEIAGGVQRQGGQVMFNDPEARLNKQFARIFDLNTDELDYSTPDRVPEVFKAVRNWELKDGKKINAVCADSLAALSTDLEMDNDDGDKMGMRRAKEFSEELRKTCRLLTEKNILMVCSNQIRENTDGFGQKHKSPGGKAIGFYSSLRLRAVKTVKLKKEKKVKGTKVEAITGVCTTFEVHKSSIDKPFRTADVTILFDYGIDDVRENLKYVKKFSDSKIYSIQGRELDNSLEKSIGIVEEESLEDTLKEQVIEIWELVQSKFQSNRKKKER